MITSTSLSAFSSAAIDRTQGMRGTTQVAQLDRVRAEAPVQQGSQQNAAPATTSTLPGSGKALPRGSLLNLTV